MSLCLLAVPGKAVTPDEILDNPVLEQRARDISAGLRCLVCQNQSIDDSDAELAKDLRLLVRQRLTEGDSDTEVIDYVVSRYGEFVLLKPRFSAQTLLLWGMPLIVLLIGAAYIMMGRRGDGQTPTVLTAEEHAELEKVLQSRDQDP
ncbi:MAG: cytochrome c-type biogenesis protein CcmH [Alphaproteobacteria bacterium]|nr:cytochrome c-type biogenesis protein CcmH [Alphaproteobacteria bacterium]